MRTPEIFPLILAATTSLLGCAQIPKQTQDQLSSLQSEQVSWKIDKAKLSQQLQQAVKSADETKKAVADFNNRTQSMSQQIGQLQGQLQSTQSNANRVTLQRDDALAQMEDLKQEIALLKIELGEIWKFANELKTQKQSLEQLTVTKKPKRLMITPQRNGRDERCRQKLPSRRRR
jgi:chromosome segregation ATPase